MFTLGKKVNILSAGGTCRAGILCESLTDLNGSRVCAGVCRGVSLVQYLSNASGHGRVTSVDDVSRERKEAAGIGGGGLTDKAASLVGSKQLL